MKLSELVKHCENHSNIYIFGHLNPDGDCIGASIALKQLLAKNNIKAKVILKDVPSIYEHIHAREESSDSIDQVIDLAIMVDCGDMTRVSDYQEELLKAQTIINIDHHASNTYYGQYNHVVENASSTCEIIYDMIDDEDMVDIQIANAIYTGIIYDTGVFKHSCTNKKTHIIAAKLIEKGIDFTAIINRLFYTKPYKAIKALGVALDHVVVENDGKIAYSTLLHHDIVKLGLKKEHSESIVHTLTEIEGTTCVFFITEFKKGCYKVSLRSKDYVDVCAVAKVFGGGGHVKAAGCSANDDINKLIDEIIHLLQLQIN